jgi:hypothetical protein
MSNTKNSVGRSLVKKRHTNQRRKISGDEWVENRSYRFTCHVQCVFDIDVSKA